MYMLFLKGLYIAGLVVVLLLLPHYLRFIFIFELGYNV